MAETGQIDFSQALISSDKYPYPLNDDEGDRLIEAIFDENGISERKKKAELKAPIRHLFWYAKQQGVDISSIDDELIMKFIVEEIPKSNSGSTHRTMRCVRYVTAYLSKHGIAPVHRDYSKLKLKSPHISIIPAYTEEEISKIIAAIDTTMPLGLRDKAIILLGCGCGLRASDIAELKLADIDWRGQKLNIVQCKTHEPITVVAGAEVMNALADYVLKARPKCNVSEVFVTIRAPYRRLNQTLATRIEVYCAKADIEKIEKRSFHSLRRSFATTMVSRGVPLNTASQMLGHKSILEDKPYVTHDTKRIAFVAMDFTDVPLRHGVYADLGLVVSPEGKGGAS